MFHGCTQDLMIKNRREKKKKKTYHNLKQKNYIGEGNLHRKTSSSV